MMKTYMAKPKELPPRKWYLIDASGKILGRLATKIATILRGKHLPTFTPHVDMGDHVIVINAEQIKVTGKKLNEKLYFRHSGYPGGFKVTRLKDLLAKKPEMVIYLAVKRMLPKNKLRKRMLKRLRIYRGSDHPHQAQKPEILSI